MALFIASIGLLSRPSSCQILTVLCPPPLLSSAEPITHFFVALFIASIGLILSPIFLLNHLTVLAAGVSVVVIAKTALVRREGRSLLLNLRHFKCHEEHGSGRVVVGGGRERGGDCKDGTGEVALRD